MVEEHCPVVWKLLKQYALRAQVCGVPFEEPMLRYQLLADEDNLQKWEDWLHAQGISAAFRMGEYNGISIPLKNITKQPAVT